MLDLYFYSALKIFHLGCLIFWLGPTLGSWWILVNFDKSKDTESYTAIYRIFLQTLWIEHIAFVGLIGTGIAMASLTQAFSQPWLSTKLIIIIAIIVPLEIVDIYIGNVKLPKLLNTASTTISKTELFYHGIFTKTAIAILPICVLAIFILAVTKMAF